MHSRKKRKWYQGLLGAALACALVISNLHGSVVYATEAASSETTEAAEDETTEASTESGDEQGEKVDASLDKAKADAEEFSRKKKDAQQILDNLKEAKSNIEDYIIQLDKNLNEMQVEINHLELNQKELEESIKETQKQLEIAKAAQEEQYTNMKLRIQMVYESGNKRYLDVLLTATSMTDMLNKTEYVSQVSAYDYNLLKEFKAAKEQVANLKQKLEKDLANNEAMQEKIMAQKKDVEDLVDAKSQEVAEYEQSIASQEEEVQKYAQAQAEAEAIIAAAEAAASNSATSTYTGGVFTWPVPGYYGITSYFGNRTSPTAGASTYHRGIDIACDTGASVVAAAGGTVIVSAYNAAEGNYVCIDHGGGVVTVYMHNSSLLVSVGEYVAAGQTIALAGSTGYSTGPHCHFGVRVDGNYVDPLGYLQ